MSRLSLFALAALASAAALAPVAARAQMAPAQSSHTIGFGLGGGVSVPVSDAQDAFKTGFNGQGFVKFNLAGLPVTPRIDFTFQRFDLKGAKLA